MHISAKVDYAMRALVELVGAEQTVIRADLLAEVQGIPIRFLERIMGELRRAGIVLSQRGAHGGYRLARPAEQITVADVIRAIDGPLAEVRGDRPENRSYVGAAEPLREVWVAVRASLRNVLEEVTVAQIATNQLPAAVTALTERPEAWH
ncbi:RrF2 family transcriptional regulator [soil metagenome]